MQLPIWTVGHSTLSVESFLELLAFHGIEAVADVRRFPASRRLPHFAREPLAQSLAARNLEYEWFPDLGGRRRPLPDSANTAWRSAAFRGYADYMATEPFTAGLGRLVTLAGRLRTAVMCAEALWWRCHRGLIADALRCSGWQVGHIMGSAVAVPHPYTSAARIEQGRLTYRAPSDPDLFREEINHVPEHQAAAASRRGADRPGAA